jgi:predicted metalloendopeptidase
MNLGNHTTNINKFMFTCFAVIPLAVLTQPYFRADVPRYIPYATIGVIFAHEMLHGFDLTGISYDAEGEHTEWFSRESLVRLEARLDCVARQYAATFRKKVSFMGANIEVQVRLTIF